MLRGVAPLWWLGVSICLPPVIVASLCVIIRHTYATETAEGTPRRVKRSQKSMGTRQAFAEFSGLARFDSQADLPTSAASNTAALHHPACCAFGVFFFSLLRHARQQLYGFLALYCFHWLPVLASLRSTFTLKCSFCSFSTSSCHAVRPAAAARLFPFWTRWRW